MSVQQSDLNDPALVTEVDLARAAAQEEAGDERVGEYVAYHVEDERGGNAPLRGRQARLPGLALGRDHHNRGPSTPTSR